jgi:YidC/Oxa1 family membrane protein insertase
MNIFQVILIQPLTNGLIFFYKILGQNLGVAILGFGLVLRFVLNPLTKPYMASMKKMKDYEPQLAKLREKYKDDKKQLLTAQSDFYKQNKINPGAGCLPYLLQIVILIALFNVFTTVLASHTSLTKLNNLLYAPLKIAANQTLNTKFLYYWDVTKPDAFSIPGIPFPLPGLFLIIATLLQFFSAKMMAPVISEEKKIAKKTESSTDDMQVAMQSSMTYMFPAMTLLFGLRFPFGLVLYWLLFSLWQVIQQYQTSGWGGLSPWLLKLRLLKSESVKR